MFAGEGRGGERGRAEVEDADEAGSTPFDIDSGYEYGREETDEVEGREKREVEVEAVAGPEDIVGAYWLRGEE